MPAWLLCGAGCMGFVNVEHGLRAIGYVEPDPIPSGPVALVSCSGSAFSAMLRTHRHFGWTVAVSSGQELVTSAASYLDYAVGVPGTKVVALLLETMREPSALRQALERAAASDVAVVALTVGRSEAGRAMVDRALRGTGGRRCLLGSVVRRARGDPDARSRRDGRHLGTALLRPQARVPAFGRGRHRDGSRLGR